MQAEQFIDALRSATGDEAVDLVERLQNGGIRIDPREDGFVRVPVSLIESIRKTLPGCSNHGCAFANRQPGSVGTNGSCNCIGNASRSQLTVLNQRISMLLNAGKEGGA